METKLFVNGNLIGNTEDLTGDFLEPLTRQKQMKKKKSISRKVRSQFILI